jgi:hypothetical protein
MSGPCSCQTRCVFIARCTKTTIQGLFLALSRLCQPIPALYRCEPQNLPLESIIQILVAAYLHKCILFLLS